MFDDKKSSFLQKPDYRISFYDNEIRFKTTNQFRAKEYRNYISFTSKFVDSYRYYVSQHQHMTFNVHKMNLEGILKESFEEYG